MKKLIVKLILVSCVAILCISCVGNTQAQLQPIVVERTPTAGFYSVQPDIPHGEVVAITYHSTTTGGTRRAMVWLPPSFSEENRYPVMFLLHGIGGDEYEWLRGGQANVILDNLYAQNRMVPMIVVMPNGRATIYEGAVGVEVPERQDAFATFEFDLLNDLIPYMEANFPVYTDRYHRAITGLSMGAGQALNFGLGNMDTFAWVGGFSPAPNVRQPAALLPNPQRALELELLYISNGGDSNLLGNATRTSNFLNEHNIPHVMRVTPGGVHDFVEWRANLYRFSQMLFRPVDPAVIEAINALDPL